jgi:hypothetical protein
MVSSLEVDNTKAIALPILFIIALLVAVFITRKTLADAFPKAKSELRFGILFFGGLINVVAAVFLFPTAGWQYGIVSALFAYCFALACAPGTMERRGRALFYATASWYAIMLGIPSKWSSGIVSSISNCKKWFPVKTDMCSDSFISFAVFCAICQLIVFFFMLLVLMSFAFDQEIEDARKAEAKNTRNEYAVPLAGNNGTNTSAVNTENGSKLASPRPDIYAPKQ